MQTIDRIVRHPALVNFSRDHHFGLLLVWKIRKGIKLGILPTRISAYVLYFFRNALEAHFEEEEREIFSLLPVNDPMRIRAQAEHAHISKLLEHLSKEVENMELLSFFATALEEHIRFEERMLFNHIQEVTSSDALNALALITPQSLSDPDVYWEDHFWVSDVYHPTQRSKNA